MNDTVIIDSTVGKDTFFLITWESLPPSISLWDPSGMIMGNFTVDAASKIAYLSIPGTPKALILSRMMGSTPDILQHIQKMADTA